MSLPSGFTSVHKKSQSDLRRTKEEGEEEHDLVVDIVDAPKSSTKVRKRRIKPDEGLL